MTQNLILYYLIGGLAFYALGWFWVYMSDFPSDNKGKKLMARFTLLFPLWPLFFAVFLLYNIGKLFCAMFKMADFGVLNGRQNRKKD